MTPNTGQTEALTRKAVIGSGWSVLANAGRQILSLLAVAFLARKLGPASYGLMGMAALVTTFLLNFRDLGTAAAIVQRSSVPDRLLCTLFWTNSALGLLLSLLVIAAAPAAARFFHQPELSGILRVLAISFCLTSGGIVHNAILQREMAFRKLAMADLSSAVAAYAVAIPCAFAGLGVWSLVFSNLASSAVLTVLYWAACPWRPSRRFAAAELRSIRGFSLNLFASTLINYGSRNADNLVVGRVLGSVPLGHYQMAYSLMLYPLQNISSVLSQVLFPAFSRLQHDNARFRSAYVRSCMLIALVTFPVMAGLGVVADPFVRAVLGAKWVPVITVFQILAPVGLIQSVQSTVGQIYVAKGRTDWGLRWNLAAFPVVLLSFLIGVRYGVAGVAAGYAIAVIAILSYPCLAVAFRIIDLRVSDFALQFWPQAAITLAMAVICAAWLHALHAAGVYHPWICLASTVLVGVVCYAAAMLYIRPAVIVHLEEVIASSGLPVALKLLPVLRVFAARR